MTIPTAVSQLLEIEESRHEGITAPDTTLAIALSRVGGGPEREHIVAGTLRQLLDADPQVFGEPLHSLVLVGKRLHPLEAEYAEHFALDKTAWREVAKSVYSCQLE